MAKDALGFGFGLLETVGRASSCDGWVIAPLAVGDSGAFSVESTCQGIVIGPSIAVDARVGELDAGRVDVGAVVVTNGALVVTMGATALGVASGYGSIGRMSPDGPYVAGYESADGPAYGPAYGSIGRMSPDGPYVDGYELTAGPACGPDANARGIGIGIGNEDARELGDDACARGVAVTCFEKRGATSKRPAA